MRGVRSARRLLGAAVLAAVATTLLASASAGTAAARQDGGPSVAVTEVDGAITPVIANHLSDAITASVEGEHAALVVRLNTPGGLVTSMRDIVQDFLNSPVPVIVWVSPQGADAGSAGTFITLAAHVAAMAPTTTIGAATPVDLEGGEVGDKVVNNAAAYAEAVAEAHDRNVEFAVASVREGRSVTVDEAVEIGAVDLVADDLATLLERVDGRTVEVRGGPVELATAGAEPVRFEMSWVRRLLQAIADPNLAFIFISIGTLAIVYEIANPGMGAGGILGAVLLILAMFSLSVLPVNLAGGALLALAAVLFVIELFIPGIGVAAAGGAIALVFGALLLFREPSGLGVDVWVAIPTAAIVLVLVALAAVLVARTRGQPSFAASDDLLGRTARLHDVDGDRGRVRLDGTWWWARSAAGTTLADDQEVVVEDRENLELVVRPASDRDEQNAPDGT